MGASPSLDPRHCPPALDCRTWTSDPRSFRDEVVHEEHLDATRALMFNQFSDWLSACTTALRSQVSIGETRLPDPHDPSRLVTVGLVDPSVVQLIIAIVQRTGDDGSGFYVGLVTQNLDSSWQGLMGFYLAWCPACDPQGRGTLREIREVVQTVGVSLEGRHAIPEGLQSRPGWFDNDRIEALGSVSSRPGLQATWQEVQLEDLHGPSLVVVGPVWAGLGNVVFLAEASDDLPRLLSLCSPARVVARRGTPDALCSLGGLPASGSPVVVTEIKRPQDVPPGWGRLAWGCDAIEKGRIGPVKGLAMRARAVVDLPAHLQERGSWACATSLRDDRAVSLTDILTLPAPAHTPA